MSRWMSISVTRTPSGWVWADHAGWGTGVYKSFLRAYFAALRGK